MKIYCASDLHIGYEQSNYPKIEEFFNIVKENADELILCGDVFDLWRCPFNQIKTERSSTYNALLSVSKKVPTTVIWGNHDYKLWKKVRLPFRITDDFVSNNIYFCHGWRFDMNQRLGRILYGWLLNKFPSLYQSFLKKPSEMKMNEMEYTALSKKVHESVKNYIQEKDLNYLIMGHTHDPVADGKLFDCGDMIDSLSYVVIDDDVPRLERMLS
jgi:UDP-2,3-diacylglucosamine pyrophosphatase LpxH